MSKFSLTAQLQLKAPTNTQQVINQLKRDLQKGATVDLKINGLDKAVKGLKDINKQTKQTKKSTDLLAASIASATKRYVAFAAAGRAISLVSKLGNAVEEAINFETQLNRISQVTGKSIKQLNSLSQTITKLSTNLGVASSELSEIGVILSQAGFKANDLSAALTALAKTQLAPTFTDIKKTAEGAVAIFNQFGKGAAALESQLGAINAVAGQFAVESDDLIDAVRRTGGVFKTAGGSLEEFIALFTSVRSTTRESAESIATGLRTIFTRIQRPKTIAFLKELGVELKNSEGNFIGPFRAVEALSKAFKDLPAGSTQFIQIAEELGGFRQIGKVIPLIQQYETAQRALNAAREGGSSLDKDVSTRQKTLATEIAKTKEEFLALVRAFSEDSAFQAIVRSTLSLTRNLISLADAIRPLIPLIGALAAPTLFRGAASLVGGLAGGIGGATKKNAGGKILGFNTGGFVPGAGNRDTVPAMLTPGEFVIRKDSVKSIGAGNLAAMNRQGYNRGGSVTVKPTDPKNYAAFTVSGNDPIASKGISYTGEENLDKIRQSLFDGGLSRQLTQQNKPINPTDLITPSSGKPRSTDFAKYVIEKTDGISLPSEVKRKNVKNIDALAKQYAEEANEKPQFTSTGNRASADFGVKIKGPFKSYQLGGSSKGEAKDSINSQFQGLISSVASTSLNDAVETIGKSDLVKSLNIEPFSINEEKLYNFNGLYAGAQNSLEGYLLEGAVGAITNAKIGRTGSDAPGGDFDYPNLTVKAQRKRLAALFPDLDGDEKFLTKGDAKRTSSLAQKKFPGKVGSEIRDRETGFKLVSDDRKKVAKRNTGGKAPNAQDTVPAMLTPGEFVINRKSAQKIGYRNLEQMNSKGVQGLNRGGIAGRPRGYNVGGAVAALGGTNIGLSALGIAVTNLIGFLDSLGESTETTTLEQQELNVETQRRVALVKTGITAIGAFVASMLLAKKATDGIKKSFQDLKSGKLGRTSYVNKAEDAEDVPARLQADRFARGSVGGGLRNRVKNAGAFGEVREETRKFVRENKELYATMKELAPLQARKNKLTNEEKKSYNELVKRGVKLKDSVDKRAKALGLLNRDGSGTLKTVGDLRKTLTKLNNTVNKIGKSSDRAEFSLENFNKQLGRTRGGQIRGRIGRGIRGGIGGIAKFFGKGGPIGIAVGALAAAAVAAGGYFRTLGESQQKQSEIATKRGRAADAAGLAKRGRENQDFAELFSVSGLIGRIVEGADGEKTRRNTAAQAGIDAAIGAVGVDLERRLTSRGQDRKAGKNVQNIELFAATASQQIKDTIAVIDQEFRAGAISAEERAKREQEVARQSEKLAQEIGKESQTREELDKSLANAKTQNDEVNEAMKNAAKAAFTAAQALRQTAKARFDAAQLGATFNAANVEVESFLSGIKTGASPIAGFVKKLDAASKDIGIDATSSIQAIRKSLKDDLAGLGLDDQIDRQADNALAANTFARSIGKRLGNLDLSTGDVGQREADVRSALFEGLGNSEADKAIKDQIEAALVNVDFNNADLSKIIKDVQANVGTLSEGLLRSAQLQAQHNATMTSLYQQREQLEARAADAQVKAIDTQLQAAKIFEQAGGDKLTIGQRSSARVAQFNAVGGLAGVNLRSGSAADINRASSQISSSFFAQQGQDKFGRILNRPAFAGPEGVTRDQRPELARAQAQLLQTTKQQIAIRQEELKIIQQKNAAEKSALEKLISGDVAGFIQQQEAAGAAAALRTGNSGLTGLFGAGALGAGFKELQKTGEANEAAANATLKAFGINGGGGVLSGETPEAKALKSEIRNLAVSLGDQAQQQAEFAKSDIDIQNATINITTAKYNQALADTAGNVTGRWMGGPIYASRGAFIPRGTDTVPAMLTPGEFVVNRKAVQSGNNLQVLRAMNSGAGSGASGQGGMNGGGQVGYYQFGGVVEAISNAFGGGVTGLMSAFGNFNQAVEKLSNLNLTLNIQDTNIRVSVDAINISGLRDQVVDSVMAKVAKEIGNTKQTNTGDMAVNYNGIVPPIA